MILITGGTGYIGSHTTVELMQAGLEVLIVDNFCNSKKSGTTVDPSVKTGISLV